MAINKSMRRVLKALSFDGIEVEASRHLANLKAIDPMKIFYKTIDYKIYNGDHQIPVRIFLPGEKMEADLPALLFFHGGGWVVITPSDLLPAMLRIISSLLTSMT